MCVCVCGLLVGYTQEYFVCSWDVEIREGQTLVSETEIISGVNVCVCVCVCMYALGLYLWEEEGWCSFHGLVFVIIFSILLLGGGWFVVGFNVNLNTILYI